MENENNEKHLSLIDIFHHVVTTLRDPYLVLFSLSLLTHTCPFSFTQNQVKNTLCSGHIMTFNSWKGPLC